MGVTEERAAPAVPEGPGVRAVPEVRELVVTEGPEAPEVPEGRAVPEALVVVVRVAPALVW
jgi:hypothetical protein